MKLLGTLKEPSTIIEMKSLPRPRIGSETSKCVEYLVAATPEIEAVAIATIVRPTPLQDRLTFSPAEAAHFKAALRIRAKSGLPFWDCLLLNCFNKESVSDRLLNQVNFHQSNVGKEIWLGRDAIVAGELRALHRKHRGSSMLSLLSRIRTSGGSSKHFVFLDFHIPSSQSNHEVVAKVVRRLLPYPAFIINSGASYHVIGTKLVSDQEFRNTLTQALLFGPITDRAYLAHQLLEDRAALRISRGGHADAVPKLLLTT